MASLKHSSPAPTLPPVVTTMGATKPEIQMHWRHEKLTHKIEQRKAEREAARIKAAALKVLTDEKERFIAEERRKARQKNMWRAKHLDYIYNCKKQTFGSLRIVKFLLRSHSYHR